METSRRNAGIKTNMKIHKSEIQNMIQEEISGKYSKKERYVSYALN